jgi:HEAT repeat protein
MSARTARLVSISLTLSLAAILGLLIYFQFRRLRAVVPPPEAGVGKADTEGTLRPRPATARGVVDVKAVETRVPDLDGQREPTREEVIRHALLKLLNELRGATPGNMDKILSFHENKAALEALLRSLPPEAVPIVADLLREESDFVCRRILIYGLAGMGTNEAAAVLKDHFMDHIEDVARGSEMRHVVWALGRSEAPAAFDVLLEFLDGETDAMRKLRSHYVESLGKHQRGVEAVPLFIDLLGNDGNDLVRNKAAQAVKNVGKRDPAQARAAVPALIDRYRAESARQAVRAEEGLPSNPYVKQTTLGAIGQSGDPAAVPFLLEVGTTDGLDERLSAAAALSRIGGPEAMAALREVYANIANQAKLVDAIGQLEEINTLPFLQDVATTAGSEALRLNALRGISRVGGPEAENALRAILDVELPPAVERDAQQRLDRLTGSGE